MSPILLPLNPAQTFKTKPRITCEERQKHTRGSFQHLIVMDDMWSIEAWDVVRRFFPKNENGSRIVVTTRLSNLASKFNYSHGHDMKFLDDANSWNLFSKEICPLELVDIGKKIVEGCKGLPLSIVVVGGLLSKCEPTRGDWEIIEQNLNSIVNSEEDGSCLQILYLSYNNLPVYIKPLFLYLGIFDEDMEIPVYMLIQLCVAEGFIKPIDGKSLEEAAEEYLEELVARNLLVVEKRSYCGELKKLKMHDLVRDVCLREAQKDKFLYVLREHSIPSDISTQRRIVCTLNDEYPSKPLIESLEKPASSFVRTLIGIFPQNLSMSSFRLLRVFLVDFIYGDSEEESSDEYFQEIFLRLVNLRLLGADNPLPGIPSSSVSSLWNLQTLFLCRAGEDNLLEIWNMPLLRHVISFAKTTLFCLPDPPVRDEAVLENLHSVHTLSVVKNLNFGEGMFERIPNIRKLKLAYYQRGEEEGDYSLHNLCRLHKLQVLRLRINYSLSSLQLMRELTLPYSLKKLTLHDTKLAWEEMETKIGCLPLFQVLKLKENSFTGSKWETVEGQFSALKYLHIEVFDLEFWITENTHFPRLEHVALCWLSKLSEIPSSIGDIMTLRSIKLKACSDSVVESARRIVEEQKDLGNEDLQLQVI